jgi:CubicO group peptidase (beta-lactamase class C family)
MPNVIINGFCDREFSAIETAFADNFSQQGEVGAAVSVYQNNQKVVDLWAGHMDERQQRPLSQQALFTVWSLGKAVAALCILRLVDAGKLNLDDAVAKHWPEFSQGGKAKITVAELLSHRAGLVAVDTTLDLGAWANWPLYVHALEQQRPWWPAGERHGYHVHTYGFLLGELLHRVDGRTIAQYLQDEISQPLGIDFYYGVDDSNLGRVADNIPYIPPMVESIVAVDPATLDTLPADDRMRYLTYNNPAFSNEGEFGINSTAWRQAIFPSTSPQANARAVAKIFSALANGGQIDGIQLLSPELIEQAIRIHADGIDAVMSRPTRFGLGFMLTLPERPLGPNPRTFGHYGNAGLLGFADPDAKLSFCYTMNKQGRAWRDPRNIALVDALYASVAK